MLAVKYKNVDMCVHVGLQRVKAHRQEAAHFHRRTVSIQSLCSAVAIAD